MNPLRIAGPLLAGCIFASCDAPQEPVIEQAAEVEWTAAAKTLDKYAPSRSEQPVVALFTMDGDAIGKQFKVHIKEHQGELFSGRMPKFIEYDCTGDTSLGYNLLIEKSVNYMPVIFVSYGKGWQHTQLPDDYLLDSTLDEGFLGEMTRVLSAAKK